MNRGKRIGRLGGLAAVAVAATPFACLWVVQVANAPDPLTARAVLDIAIWMAVLATPTMLAAWLLWRAWWRQAGPGLSGMDGPAWLLSAAGAMLPADRREWGAAMAAELAQVEGVVARWRFAAGCARAAVFPGGNRAAVLVAGALAVAAVATAALVTAAALPAGRVFALTFVGLLGGLAVLAAARWRRLGWTAPGPALTGLALAGVTACLGLTVHYLAEHPSYDQVDRTVAVSLPPVTAVVLAAALAGCLALALRPPRWLLPDRKARWFGIAMAVALVGGFLLDARLVQPGLDRGGQGMMGYLFNGPLLVILPRIGAGRRGGTVAPLGPVGVRLGRGAGGAPARHRLAGRGAALGPGRSGGGPGRGRAHGGGRQPGRRGLVAPDLPDAVGPPPGGPRRRRRQLAGPPPGPSGRRVRPLRLNGPGGRRRSAWPRPRCPCSGATKPRA
jgi:hypothetical protein